MSPRDSPSSPPYDAVIVGGGHNGLVCAAYLAGAGLSVCVLERREIVGGAAVTEEFHPGFRNSTASYTVSLLSPDVIRELDLAAHGLCIVKRPLANFLPLPQNAFLKIGGGVAATQAEVAKFSARDAERLPAYYAMLERAADVVRDLLLTGRSINAAKALDTGLVSQVSAEGEALRLARAAAAQIAKFDRVTSATAKRFLKPIPREELRQEIDVFCELFVRPAVMEGLRKFVESTDAHPYLP